MFSGQTLAFILQFDVYPDLDGSRVYVCEIWRLMDGWINDKAARVGIAMDQEVQNFAFADGANFRQRCYDFTLLFLSFDACIAGTLSDFSADIRFLHLLHFEGDFD